MITVKGEILSKDGTITSILIESGRAGIRVTVENPNGKRELALTPEEAYAMTALFDLLDPAYKDQA